MQLLEGDGGTGWMYMRRSVVGFGVPGLKRSNASPYSRIVSRDSLISRRKGKLIG